MGVLRGGRAKAFSRLSHPSPAPHRRFLSLLGPSDRQPMITGEGVHPGLVVGRALPQDLFVDDRYADHSLPMVADEKAH